MTSFEHKHLPRAEKRLIQAPKIFRAASPATSVARVDRVHRA